MRARGGFTLVEVLVAVVIIGLVGAATASSLSSTTNLLGENSHYLTAAALAQATIEDLRAVPYDEMRDEVRESDDGLYVLTTKVVDDSPEPGLKEISVTASWEWKGQPRSYELHTVYMQPTKD
jgi:prepilin-type N-terminal cleavage/methylation domain-containing protein